MMQAAPRVKFIEDHSFDRRKEEASSIRYKYPGRTPIICEKYDTCDTDIPALDKRKYLVPGDMTLAQFCFVIRKRMKLRPEKSIFMFLLDRSMPPMQQSISAIYSEKASDDGFLYMLYTGENTFGGR